MTDILTRGDKSTNGHTRALAGRIRRDLNDLQQRLNREQTVHGANIRAWAIEQGIGRHQMGRLPQHLIDQYKAAHSGWEQDTP